MKLKIRNAITGVQCDFFARFGDDDQSLLLHLAQLGSSVAQATALVAQEVLGKRKNEEKPSAKGKKK